MAIFYGIPKPNLLKKRYASLQKCKKEFIQSFLFIFKQNRQKTANRKF